MEMNNLKELGLSHPANELTVSWADRRLARITRLRLLSDPGYPAWDVSYCWGVLKDGTEVQVQLPFSDLPKGRNKAGKSRMYEALFRYAKQDGVYLKGLGLFSGTAISTLN